MTDLRSIDHFVLVTEHLDQARALYRRLGFLVAPDGVHPFGTHNANMYFRDGPMIESLAVESAARYAAAIRAGNSFVRNDAAFRAARGSSGFSHVVVTSDDADADHAGFVRRGVSGGDLVAFTREFEQPDGTLDTVSARLAFATHPQAGCGCYFSCQDIVVPQVDRSDLLDHPNGALGVRQAVSCSGQPQTYRGFLESLVAPNLVQTTGDGVDCLFPNGRASVVTPAALARDYGIAHDSPGADLVHHGLVFAVSDLAVTEALFVRNQIRFDRVSRRLVTRVDPNTGPFFAFEQTR